MQICIDRRSVADFWSEPAHPDIFRKTELKSIITQYYFYWEQQVCHTVFVGEKTLALKQGFTIYLKKTE